jgi:hypothetical protein
MATPEMIAGLLNKLVAENNQIFWTTRCCFTDGQGKSFHEIRLYWKKEKKEKIIIYQMETGRILNYVCKGLDLNNCDNIVDVLLDLINAQKLAVYHPGS